MSTWKARVEVEAEQLLTKIDALKSFLERTTPNAVDEEHRLLLQRQLEVMGKYHTILRERLERFGEN